MDGEIGVTSEIGKGSIFWFNFMAKESDMIVVKSNESENQMFKFTGYVPSILLVDDNHINQKVAGEILKYANCEVDTVSDGQSAINKVAYGKYYDLVLMDVQMPGMDGIEATQHIKRLTLNRIPPIIAMTAYSMAEDKSKFIDSGMDDYVSKPIRAEILLAKIKEWISKQLPDLQNFTTKSETPKTKSESGKVPINSVPEIIVDEKIMASLRNLGGEDLVQETYAELIPESYEQITLSIEAAKTQDLAIIKRELHTLKGNSGTLGVLKISKLAEIIEQGIKRGDSENLTDNLDKLLILWEEFKNHFENIIKIK